MPESFDVAVRTAPVLVLVSVALALGTKPPD